MRRLSFAAQGATSRVLVTRAACCPYVRHFIGAGPPDPILGTPPPTQGSRSESSPTQRQQPPPPTRVHGGPPVSYRDTLRVYVANLQEYCSRSTEAVTRARQRAAEMEKMEAELPETVKQDSLWSIAPVLVLLWLYVRDTADRSYAQYAHRSIKEHTQLHSKVKYVKL